VRGTVIDLPSLAELHPAITARILRELCEEAGVPGDRVPLDALIRLARGRHGTSQIDLPNGVVAERRYARLRVGPPDLPPAPTDDLPVRRAGTVEIDGVRLRFSKKLLERGPYVLRRPKPGDRVRGRRLADLLVDAKVPRPDRAHLWALARQKDGDVAWVGLFRAKRDGATGKPGAMEWEWPSSGERPRPAQR
jgi:hypothetical protein